MKLKNIIIMIFCQNLALESLSIAGTLTDTNMLGSDAVPFTTKEELFDHLKRTTGSGNFIKNETNIEITDFSTHKDPTIRQSAGKSYAFYNSETKTIHVDTSGCTSDECMNSLVHEYSHAVRKNTPADFTVYGGNFPGKYGVGENLAWGADEVHSHALGASQNISAIKDQVMCQLNPDQAKIARNSKIAGESLDRATAMSSDLDDFLTARALNVSDSQNGAPPPIFNSKVDVVTPIVDGDLYENVSEAKLASTAMVEWQVETPKGVISYKAEINKEGEGKVSSVLGHVRMRVWAI